MVQSIAIVGCGLLGGSLALRIKQVMPSCKLYGVNRRLDHIRKDPRSSCFEAIVNHINQCPKEIDLVMVCTPIKTIISTIKQVADYVSPQTIITDIASTKEAITTHVKALNIQQTFIPGHPMAGKETTGFQHADGKILQDAPYFLVANHTDEYQRLKKFVRSLGCNVIEIAPEDHDKVVAHISHIPYLMAGVLTQTAISSVTQDLVKASYGPGFKDSTRVASSSDQWGREVVEQNSKAILSGLSDVITYCQQLKEIIKDQNWDKIQQQLNMTKEIRDNLSRD